MADVSSNYINENKPMTAEEQLKELEAIDAGEDPSVKPPPLAPLMVDPVEVVETRPAEDLGVGDYAGDIAYGAARGVVGAGREIVRTGGMLTDMALQGLDKLPFVELNRQDPDYFYKLAKESTPDTLDKTKTVAGGFTESTAQFLTGFIPALRGMRFIAGAKGLGAASTVQGQAMVNSVNTGINAVKHIAGAGTAGAIADMTVFDPYEARISNWVAQTNSPEAIKAVAEFLQADPNDPAPIAKVKAALEGVLVGKMLEPVMQVLGHYKDFKTAVIKDKLEVPEQTLAGNAPVQTAQQALEEAPVARAANDSPNYEWPTVTMDVPQVRKLTPEEEDTYAKLWLEGDLEGAARLGSETVNFRNITSEDDVKDMIAAYTLATENARGKVKRTWAEMEANNASIDGGSVVETLAAKANKLDSHVTMAREFRANAAYKLTKIAALAKQGNDAAKADFLKAIDEFGVINSYVNRATGEVARATASMRKTVSGEWMARNVTDIVEQHGREGIDKLILAVSNAPNSEYVQKAVYAATQPNWKDALAEVYINSLFSAKTLLINGTSNVLTVGNTVLERYAGAFKSQYGGSGELTFKEANSYAVGLVSSIWDGMGAFARSWSKDMPTFSPYQQQDMLKQGGAFRAETFGIDAGSTPILRGLGKGLDLLGSATRAMGTRTLMATDEMFKTILYQSQLKALAVRETTKKGIKEGTPEFTNSINDIMQQAYKAPVGKPYHGLSIEALGHAEQNTFTEELGSKIGKNLSQLIRHTPMGITVVPFVKTPTNILKYVGRRTPGISAFSEHMERELAAGGARADLAHAQMSLGAMYLSVGFMAAAAGYVRGDMTENLTVKKGLQELGIQGRSVGNAEGETQPIGRLDPLSSFFILSANTYERLRVALDQHGEDLTDDEVDQMVGEAIGAPLVAATRLAVNMSMATGVQRALDFLADPDSRFEDYAQQTGGAFLPFQNQLRLINQSLPEDSEFFVEGDGLLREADSIQQEWMSKIPGLSKQLPPVPDMFGEPIKPSNTLMPNEAPKQGPVYEELRRLQMQNPEKLIFGGKTRYLKAGDSTVKLNGVEKWNFMQFVKNLKDSQGRDLMGQLEDLVSNPKYQEASDETKKEKLQELYTRRKEMAEKALKYDSALAARGMERKYAKAYNLWDYPEKTPLAERLLQGEASKRFKKAGQYERDADVTREEFVANRMDEIIESELGLKFAQ